MTQDPNENIQETPPTETPVEVTPAQVADDPREFVNTNGTPVETLTQDPYTDIEQVAADVGGETPIAKRERTLAADASRRVHLKRSEPTEPSKTVTLTRPLTRPLTTEAEKQDVTKGFHLWTLNQTAEEFAPVGESLNNLNLTATPEVIRWLEGAARGSRLMPTGNYGQRALGAEGSDWQQTVDYNGEEMMIGRPVATGGNSSTNGRVSGEEAKSRLKARLGVGSLAQAPMWHSGFWVSLQAPGEGEMLELEQQLGNSKITLGRVSGGLAFSANNVYHQLTVVNFAISKMYDSTLKDISPAVVKQKMLITDIPLLMLQLGLINNPNGYPLARPCTNHANECQHIEEEVLNLSRLMFVNRRALSQNQRRLMARRTQKTNDAELTEYVNGHAYSSTVLCAITDDVYVEFAVPTVELYEKSSFDWINSIEERVDAAFGTSLDGQERDQYILAQSRMATARQYSHWVKRIIFKNTEEAVPGVLTYDPEVDDVDDVRESFVELLGEISSRQDVVENFVEGVQKFIDSVTVAMVAIPRYECRVCGAEQTVAGSKHPRLLPLDVTRLFFTLLGQRTAKAISASVM